LTPTGYSGYEALEFFVGSGIRLRVGGVDIQARQMKGSFREEFLKLYNGGHSAARVEKKPDNGMRPTPLHEFSQARCVGARVLPGVSWLSSAP
jgi:hypothetical protein